MKKAGLILMLIGFMLLTTAFAGDETVTWSNQSGGSWNIAAYWTPAKIPSPLNDVVVGASGVYTITVDSDVFINSLTIGAVGDNSLTLSSGTLTLASGAASAPVSISVSGQTVTVTEEGTLKDLAFNFPQVPPGGITVSMVSAGQAPPIPAGVTRLSDFFYVSPVANSGGMITVALPISGLPAGRSANDLRLYVYSDAAQDAGPGISISGRFWIRTWYDLNVLPDGRATIKLSGLGDLSFIGIEAPVAPTAVQVPVTTLVSTRRGPLAVAVNCQPKVINGNPDANWQVCTAGSGTDKSFTVTVKNFADLHLTPAATLDELVGWLAAGRLAFDGYGLLSDPAFEVDVGRMPKAGALGYVTSGNLEDRSVLHITSAAELKNSVQGTTVHEFFHHAQSRTKAAGKTNLIDTNHVGDWLIEGLARWVEDDIFDSLNTYMMKEHNPLRRLLETGLGPVPNENDSKTRAYARFAFWKMVQSSCTGFSIPAILNVDTSTDPNGLVLFKSMAESANWQCDFGSGFGGANRQTLASALLSYTYASVKENNLSLLDSNEPISFGFENTSKRLVASADCKSWDDCPASSWISVRGTPASAVPFLVNSVPSLNPEEAVVLEIEPLPAGTELWVWVGDNEKPGGLSNGAWYKSSETITHVYAQGARAPEMMAVVVMPSPQNSGGFRVRASRTGLKITSLTPSSGKVGDAVTISGTGFGAEQLTSTITFNGTAASDIISWSDTSIVVKVPIAATTGNVVVTVNGVASNGVTFTIKSDCINDPYSGLCWLTSEAGYFTWDAAFSYCAGNGTRLPSIYELITFATSGAFSQIPEYGHLYDSCTDLRSPLEARGYLFYPSNPVYWSSTTVAGDPGYAWRMDFSCGYVLTNIKLSYDYVWCVRGGQ